MSSPGGQNSDARSATPTSSSSAGYEGYHPVPVSSVKEPSDSVDSRTPLEPEPERRKEMSRFRRFLERLRCGPRKKESTERRVFANDGSRNNEFGYPDNTISNTKYSWLTFLPKNLMEQFRLHINRYFLIIACLQLWDEITPVNPATTWVPLIVIFSITAIKELLDDLGRRREDKAANARKYTVVRDGQSVEVQSWEIQVGDILELHEDDEIPADCVLLSSSDPQGICYIQTTNLDGESNWKTRVSLHETRNLDTNAKLGQFKGIVMCQSPDDEGFDNLEKFDSALRTVGHEDVPLSLDSTQLLLQATNVRNTQFLYALVVYTGNETKFGKNKKIPPSKTTKTDELINEFAGLIFTFQLVLVFILGIVGNIWKGESGRSSFYLHFPPSGREPGYQPLVIPLRFLLLNSTMIPISLKVTLDLCKLYYSKFINADLDLYDEEMDRPAHSNSTALAEDLGQVEYILSDKTGTLTENVMVMKACSVRGEQYGSERNAMGQGTDEDVGEATVDAKGTMEDPRFRRAVQDSAKESTNGSIFLDFLRCICLNNTVTISREKSSTLRRYKASSPDEEALVDGASHYGVALVKRGQESAVIVVPSKEAPAEGLNLSLGEYATITGTDQALSEGTRSCVNFEEWDILEEFEFSSDRKRMSVLVKQREKEEIRMYVKGADDVMFARLSSSEKTSKAGRALQEQVDSFASAGLRTLVMAYRTLSLSEYREWKKDFDAANSLLTGRDEAKEKCYNRLEKELNILGATAIEDKLQGAVPETIAQLRRAGIKMWMCTGDKYSTAKTIARTCRLSDQATDLFAVEGETKEEVNRSLEDNMAYLQQQGVTLTTLPPPLRGFFRGFRKNTGLCVPPGYKSEAQDMEDISRRRERVGTRSTSFEDFACIIRGSTLRVALQDEDMRRKFAAIALSANTVICCRVNPRQKAQLVSLVRDAERTVLSIGDGGNDVSMIQEAQVGVGIRGKEGLQAARAADYQISFFKHLLRLVLIHGRYSYYRTSLVGQYSFYKSFVFCFMQIGYAFVSAFSGVSLFNSLSVAAYNAVLFVPIVFFFVDKDIDQETALAKPEAYSVCRKGELMNYRTMGRWFIRAIYQASMLLIIGLVFPPTDSDLFQYQVLGLVIFFGYLWVQDFTMLFELRKVTVYNVVSIFGLHIISYAVAIGWNLLQSALWWDFLDYYSVNKALGNGVTWLVHLLMIIVCIGPVEAWKSWKFRYSRNFYNDLLLGEFEVKRKGIEADWSDKRSTRIRNTSYRSVHSGINGEKKSPQPTSRSPPDSRKQDKTTTTPPQNNVKGNTVSSGNPRYFSVLNKRFAGVGAGSNRGGKRTSRKSLSARPKSPPRKRPSGISKGRETKSSKNTLYNSYDPGLAENKSPGRPCREISYCHNPLQYDRQNRSPTC
eukprot:gb/GECG01003348.1/.p1 GENE.gb/GECG01003348.1/~~gb/GECG01003348.1/.p1  ORF type:complete len:1398 (+),score=180.54 gb/GECG01003348.1/:1-4194(+)